MRSTSPNLQNPHLQNDDAQESNSLESTKKTMQILLSAVSTHYNNIKFSFWQF
ncbi:hypothetical protein [Helicobacter cinaedi]|uniref:Uncharacterized protein n=1 Tax=Helicobacter cinaedi CCUG 18818 = ATCC BAA-847 TaxID=537971 RepID=A0ABN0BBD2_9HELI|nr:hypothetical protein [Helicobacter cinaedi]EFR46475.1 hypothetical protein HCCG_01022 [Helicobacter cinaedi CCUG 18818 = ATCC BAA-847]